MQPFSSKLLANLEEQLSSIEQEHEVILKRSELSFFTCKVAFDQLKDYIINYKFKSASEEINFFKEVKPRFTSRLIFHLMLYNIETKKPNGGNEIVRKYLVKELEGLKAYCDYNLDFYKYYRGGASYLDHKYFMRNSPDIHLSLEGNIFENDTRFSTTHDFKVAKILAHDLLQVFIEDELACREHKEPHAKTQDAPKIRLSWVESKAALIELIYGLHTQGAFGKQSDIKEIASYFENTFNIDLGDYYRAFLELRTRKTNRTKFLDTVRENLLKRMDEQDEK
jgi:hypothetical protein